MATAGERCLCGSVSARGLCPLHLISIAADDMESDEMKKWKWKQSGDEEWKKSGDEVWKLGGDEVRLKQGDEEERLKKGEEEERLQQGDDKQWKKLFRPKLGRECPQDRGKAHTRVTSYKKKNRVGTCGNFSIGKMVRSLSRRCVSVLGCCCPFPLHTSSADTDSAEDHNNQIMLHQECVNWLKEKNQADVSGDGSTSGDGATADPTDSLATFLHPPGHVIIAAVEVAAAAPNAVDEDADQEVDQDADEDVVRETVDLGGSRNLIVVGDLSPAAYTELVFNICPHLDMGDD